VATTLLYTFQDAVEDLLDPVGDGFTARDRRMARRAVQDAYLSLVNAHRWGYFYQHGSVSTVADESTSGTTGTIAYDHTGGAAERLVTITDSTWPDWAEYGTLLIDGRPYNVESRESDTTLTLTAATNPGADVAAGTSYTIYRDTYPLAINFLQAGPLRDVVNGYEPDYVRPSDWLEVASQSFTPATPRWYTFIGEPEHYGTMAVRFMPPPTAACVYDFPYRRAARQLLTERSAAGTVSTAGTAVTGVGTAFNSLVHPGSVIRLALSSANPEPGGLAGGLEGGVYYVQRIVLSVASTTSLVMDASAGSNLSGVRYTISDPLDINTNTMLGALRAMARAEMAEMTDARSESRYARSVTRYREKATQALLEAMAADEMSHADFVVGRTGGESYPQLGPDEPVVVE